jgi:Protein of unknown function (DUF3500)
MVRRARRARRACTLFEAFAMTRATEHTDRHRRPGLTPVLALLLSLLVVPTGARESDVARDMREAATALLASLDESQRAKATFEFGADERLNWHFVPRERKGLPLYAMTAAQQKAAATLLRSALSSRGVEKADRIRQLEDALVITEKERALVPQWDGRPYRDRERYFFTIFGTPSADKVWGWRYEGHHVSQNWTIVSGSAVASSPQFFGSNPAEVREGPLKGLRVLAGEEDLARTFLASLDENQKTLAVVSTEAPKDIFSMNSRDAAAIDDRGVTWAKLTHGQQKLLTSVIEEYAFAQAPKIGAERMARVKKDLESIRFAWLGSIEKGGLHYYRVQGAGFLIEYDNTQNSGNHIHSVWRDFKGDFGRDLLAEHYKRDHSGSSR